MKVAIAASGNNIEGQVSGNFGRTPGFFISGEGTSAQYIENENRGGMRAVGIAVAQKMEEKGVKAVVAGMIGPRAMDALKSLGIEAYKAEPGTVKENLVLFREGKLRKIA